MSLLAEPAPVVAFHSLRILRNMMIFPPDESADSVADSATGSGPQIHLDKRTCNRFLQTREIMDPLVKFMILNAPGDSTRNEASTLTKFTVNNSDGVLKTLKLVE